MEDLLRKVAVCVALTCGAVFCQNPNTGSVGTPQRGNFNCPQERGQFEAPGDCTRFYQCDGGVATLVSCQPQLIFSPQLGFCDWPHRASNPNCAGGTSVLTPQTSQLCRTNPGDPNEAFVAGHPELCNAFYTCGTSYLYPACTFCGEGMYFSVEARGCRDYLSLGQDVNVLCGGRQFVQHADKVLRQLDGSCWPYANIQNPFLALIESIRSGGTRPARPG